MKNMIQIMHNKAKISPNRQRLLYKGKWLEFEDKCLADYSEPNNATIDLTLRGIVKIYVKQPKNPTRKTMSLKVDLNDPVSSVKN